MTTMPPSHTTPPTGSRTGTKPTRVVVVPAAGGPPSEFWAEEFDLSYQDDGRTLKLLAFGTTEQAEQARAARARELTGDFCGVHDTVNRRSGGSGWQKA